VNSLANALSGVICKSNTLVKSKANAIQAKVYSDKKQSFKINKKTVNVVINKLANIGYKVE
jgi:hypothetical protein